MIANYHYPVPQQIQQPIIIHNSFGTGTPQPAMVPGMVPGIPQHAMVPGMVPGTVPGIPQHAMVPGMVPGIPQPAMVPGMAPVMPQGGTITQQYPNNPRMVPQQVQSAPAAPAAPRRMENLTPRTPQPSTPQPSTPQPSPSDVARMTQLRERLEQLQLHKKRETRGGIPKVPREPCAPEPKRRVEDSNVGENVSMRLTAVCDNEELRELTHVPSDFCKAWKNMGESEKQSCGRTFRYAGTGVSPNTTGLNIEDVVMCIDKLSEGNTRFVDISKMRECVTDTRNCHVLSVPVCQEYFDAVLTIADNPKMESCREHQRRQAENLGRMGTEKVEVMVDLLRGGGGGLLTEEQIEEKATSLHTICDWGRSRAVGSGNDAALMTVADTFYRMPAAARAQCNEANGYCKQIVTNTMSNPVDTMCAMVQRAVGNEAYVSGSVEFQRQGDGRHSITEEKGSFFIPPFDEAFDKISYDCNFGSAQPRRDVMSTLSNAKPDDHRNLCGRLAQGTSFLKRMDETVMHAVALSSY